MPLLLDDTHGVSTGFIVEDMYVDAMAAGFGYFHYGGVGSKAVGVLLGLERRLKDHIRFTVVGDHNLLTATARANGEAAIVVCVHFANVLYVYM